MYFDIGAYDMLFSEINEMFLKACGEKFKHPCIDMAIKNEGKHRIFNESKNTYTECICESEAF